MLVKFSVGASQLALPVNDVDEVIRIVAITPVFDAPPFVEGVINRRGEITPVIDLRKRAGLVPGPFDSTTHILITRARGRHVGLIVDAVTDIAPLDEGETVTVMDPATILTPEEGRAFDAAQIA